MPPEKQRNNPYSSAAGAYGNNAQKSATDPRELEARVLLKSAQFLQDLQNNWDGMTSEVLQETLKYNRNIWIMFHDTAINEDGAERPVALRNNIYNLATFIFKREMEIIATPAKQKLDILININKEIAKGLLASASRDSAVQANTAGTRSPDADEKSSSSGGWSSSA